MIFSSVIALYLPLPGSSADMSAAIFFLGLVGLIAFQVYQTRPNK
ncbi:hypothetical protein [Leptolyngbya iicbica]|nr:hypothetical protein [Leptolyngbya sp. LK]